MPITGSPEHQALKPGFRWDQPQNDCADIEETDFESDLAQAFAASEETYSADVERWQREAAELAAAMQASLSSQNVVSRHQQMAPRLRFEVPQE